MWVLKASTSSKLEEGTPRMEGCVLPCRSLSRPGKEAGAPPLAPLISAGEVDCSGNTLRTPPVVPLLPP